MSSVILFADSNQNTYYKRTNSSLRTLGTYRIASEVRVRGFKCQVIEMMSVFTISELEQICRKFINNETLIVGFSTSFWTSKATIENTTLSERVKAIIDCAKQLSPNVKIIMGGPNSLDFLEKTKIQIDAIMTGYGEHAFINYFESIINKKPLFPDSFFGKIPTYSFVEKSPVFDFTESQTYYDKSDCLFHGEPVTLEVGRGCIFKCKFCSYPLTGKKKLDHIKNPEIIRGELIRNYKNFGIDKYIISDDTFNDSNEKLDMLHAIFTNLPFKVNFSAYLRLDLLNAHRQQIPKLKEMGLTGCFFGVETFHEQAARTIGKGIVHKVAKDLLYDLKTKHWGNDVKIAIGLITGLPHETHDSYQETYNWIDDDDYCLIESIGVTPLKLLNPKLNFSTWKSEFELDPEKYGYEWKSPIDPYHWINNKSPVKSFQEAITIQKTLYDVIEKRKRMTQGGFLMFLNYMQGYFFDNKKSWDEQLKMNRYQYVDWWRKEKEIGFNRYIEAYRNKVLNLLN